MGGHKGIKKRKKSRQDSKCILLAGFPIRHHAAASPVMFVKSPCKRDEMSLIDKPFKRVAVDLVGPLALLARKGTGT